jgi:DNA-binding response OmpR family regulator
MTSMTKSSRPILEKVPQQDEVRILVLSCSERQHAVLRKMLGLIPWTVYHAYDREGALTLLRREPIGVVLCDRNLPDGSWRDVLEDMSEFFVPPRLVVMAEEADASFWAEVLSVGGHEVLLVPVRLGELVGAGLSAWRSWNRRLQAS